MNTQSWKWRHDVPRIFKPFSFQVVFSGFFYGLLALYVFAPALGLGYFTGFPAAFASGLLYGALMGGLSALARRVMPRAGGLAGLGLMLAGAAAGGLIWLTLQALAGPGAQSPLLHVEVSASLRTLSIAAGALIGPVGLLILHRNWRKNDPDYKK